MEAVFLLQVGVLATQFLLEESMIATVEAKGEYEFGGLYSDTLRPTQKGS